MLSERVRINVRTQIFNRKRIHNEKHIRMYVRIHNWNYQYFVQIFGGNIFGKLCQIIIFSQITLHFQYNEYEYRENIYESPYIK